MDRFHFQYSAFRCSRIKTGRDAAFLWVGTSFEIRLAIGTVSIPMGTSEVPANGLLGSIHLTASPFMLPHCLALQWDKNGLCSQIKCRGSK